ncbi:glycosyltransferase family protein [Desulfovulcanus sp.]
MNVLWIGNPYCSKDLVSLGWQIEYFPTDSILPLTWEELKQKCSFCPDLVVLADKSLPPLLLDVVDFPCLTLFYCVDSHIHSWHPLYAQAFDLVTVAMRDYLPQFSNKILTSNQILWLPLFARDSDFPRKSELLQWDVLFVGKNDPQLTPLRFNFLNKLQKSFPNLVIKQGDYTKLYPHAKIVLNFADRGDLNFRVFETLGCGKCLVTNRAGNGLLDLFAPEKDLFVYDPENLKALVELFNFLLANPDLCQRVAQNGYEKVNAFHRSHHRAARLHQWIQEQDIPSLLVQRQKKKKFIYQHILRPLFLHCAEQIKIPAWQEKYIKAAQGQQDKRI